MPRKARIDAPGALHHIWFAKSGADGYSHMIRTGIPSDFSILAEDCEMLQSIKWQGCYVWTKRKGYISGMHNISRHHFISKILLEPLHRGSHGRARGGRELYLDGHELCAGLHHDIHLCTGNCPPEVDLWIDPAMC